MVQSPSRPIALEEFLQLPETKPASEYIDGQIIQKPMPQGKHSTIQTEFSTTVNVLLKPQHIARAFSELRCTFGGRSIVPDVSVFTQQPEVFDQSEQTLPVPSFANELNLRVGLIVGWLLE
jgi:Uma2 family endonuclease